MIRLYVIYYILVSILSYFFPLKKSKLYYSGKNLLSPSFRIKNRDRENIFSIFKITASTIKAYFSNRIYFHERNKYSNNLIYDGKLKNPKMRIDYVRYHSGNDVKGVLAKDTIIGYLGINTLIGDSFQIMLLTLCLFPAYLLLVKKRGVIALAIKQSLEIHRLLKFCQKNTIKTIYFFCIYQNDSNITALLLQKFKISVIKIASEVPLVFWNKIIICDCLCICNAYQYDEIKYFNQSMFFRNTAFWGPESMLHIMSKYIDTNSQSTPNVIGFYSTGGWIRELEGEMDQGVNMIKNEHIVKKYIAAYLKHNTKKLKLIIFLHPNEKNKKYEVDVKKHYNIYFSNINYSYNKPTENTANSFEKTNLAIAFNSTIIYERLYFGFKCLLMPLHIENFPLENSTLKNICAFNKEEFFNKLEKNLNYTEEEYFKINKLENYTYHFSQQSKDDVIN